MDSCDLDSLRQLASEHHEGRLHEADAERLARELHDTSQTRRRLLRFSVRLRSRHANAQASLGSTGRQAMQPEPDQVATSLGLDSSTIQWLEARGLLPRLALTEQQARARLYHAHLAFLLTRAERPTLAHAGQLLAAPREPRT